MLALFVQIPFLLQAQKTPLNDSVNWETVLSWNQIKDAAKTQNKYIFVDCYASWCQPCKAMERTVYPNDTVFQLLNKNFISVKFQFDSTKDDPEEVRKRYEDVSQIDKQYHLEGFPTFLFFTPDGILIHRDIGYKNVPAFVDVITTALDPKRKQLLALLEKYQTGERDYSAMPDLIKAARELMGDKALAKRIAEDYKLNFLDKLTNEELFSKGNLTVISQYFSLVSSGDKLFWNIYYHRGRADTLANSKVFSARLINYVINKEEIDAKLWVDGKPITKRPKWDSLNSAIKHKYPGWNADSIISTAQFSFYKKINDWKAFADCAETAIKKFPPVANGHKFSERVGAAAIWGGDAWALNGLAWDLFLKCQDKKLLDKALKWSNMSLELGDDPRVMFQYYDTKANILYKLQRKSEAIKIEEKALEFAKIDAQKYHVENHPAINDYLANLAKMRNDEPTWSTTDSAK